MIDFLPEQVRTLNELETATFNFILSNLSSIDKMSVRQLAQAVHVSTATVMRMTRKLGFEGWVELKYYLKNQNQLTEIPVNYYENLLQLDLFLRKITSIYLFSDMNAGNEYIPNILQSLFVPT